LPDGKNRFSPDFTEMNLLLSSLYMGEVSKMKIYGTKIRRHKDEK
jgi:hypothetical protein